VFLNHMVEAIQMGGRPGMPPAETSPGGKALKFYASLRLAYKQVGNIKGQASDALLGETTAQVVATKVKVKVTKNKVGLPFREALVLVRSGYGFDNIWSALQVLTAHGKVVAGTSGHFYFDAAKVPDLVHPDMALSGTKRPFIRGESAVSAFAQQHPDWATKIIDHAVTLVEQYGGEPLVDALPADEEE